MPNPSDQAKQFVKYLGNYPKTDSQGDHIDIEVDTPNNGSFRASVSPNDRVGNIIRDALIRAGTPPDLISETAFPVTLNGQPIRWTASVTETAIAANERFVVQTLALKGPAGDGDDEDDEAGVGAATDAPEELNLPPQIQDGLSIAEYLDAFLDQKMGDADAPQNQVLSKFKDQFELALSRNAITTQNRRGEELRVHGATDKERAGEFGAIILNLTNLNYLNHADDLSLRYLLGVRKASSNRGTLGISIAEDGTLTGRPGFSKYTHERLSMEYKPYSMTEHKRHVVAWHTIRDAHNALVKDPTGMAQLSDLFEQKSAKIPPALLQEAEQHVQKLDDSKSESKLSPEFKNAYKALFIMNSNDENLWRGDGKVNQALPGITNNCLDKVTEALGDKDAFNLADLEALGKTIGEIAAQKSDVNYEVALTAVAQSLFDHVDDKRHSGNAEDLTAVIDAKRVTEIAMDSVIICEIDIIPSSGRKNNDGIAPEVIQTEELRDKPSIPAARKFLTGDKSTKTILELMGSLLSFDETPRSERLNKSGENELPPVPSAAPPDDGNQPEIDADTQVLGGASSSNSTSQTNVPDAPMDEDDDATQPQTQAPGGAASTIQKRPKTSRAEWEASKNASQQTDAMDEDDDAAATATFTMNNDDEEESKPKAKKHRAENTAS